MLPVLKFSLLALVASCYLVSYLAPWVVNGPGGANGFAVNNLATRIHSNQRSVVASAYGRLTISEACAQIRKTPCRYCLQKLKASCAYDPVHLRHYLLLTRNFTKLPYIRPLSMNTLEVLQFLAVSRQCFHRPCPKFLLVRFVIAGDA